VRIVAVRVFLSDHTISPVNVQLSALALAHLSGEGYRLLLRIELFRGALCPSLDHAPSSIRMRDHVLRFFPSHDLALFVRQVLLSVPPSIANVAGS
jgi:hypothetical protein